MTQAGTKSTPKRLRFSVSLITQGRKQFYTVTMPSDVLTRTCAVTTRKEDPKKGFQRELDDKRATDIARYIDDGGTIPNSIVLSAQPAAKLKVVGQGKTLEFEDTKGAFLILDGQHRVFGFMKAKVRTRVPVVIYNGLDREEESRLFIDINTKQRPVPNSLLLDIKKLADVESKDESLLRDLFDIFNERRGSALTGLMAPADTQTGKLNRVSFNAAVKPLLEMLADRSTDEIYEILNNYLSAIVVRISDRTAPSVLAKPVVFRGVMGLFPAVGTRVKDKFGVFTESNFGEVITPVFKHIPVAKLEKPGTSWTALRDYLDKRLKKAMTL